MMEALLYAIPSWLLFLFIVGGSVGLVWLATVLLRRVTTAWSWAFSMCKIRQKEMATIAPSTSPNHRTMGKAATLD